MQQRESFPPGVSSWPRVPLPPEMAPVAAPAEDARKGLLGWLLHPNGPVAPRDVSPAPGLHLGLAPAAAEPGCPCARAPGSCGLV